MKTLNMMEPEGATFGAQPVWFWEFVDNRGRKGQIAMRLGDRAILMSRLKIRDGSVEWPPRTTFVVVDVMSPRRLGIRDPWGVCRYVGNPGHRLVRADLDSNRPKMTASVGRRSHAIPR